MNEMLVTADVPFLHAGENISRTLKISVPTQILSSRSLRLAFITPSGKSLLTEPLTVENGECVYLLPFDVLDRYGRLLAQIFITDDSGYCIKSDIFEFAVYPGIDEQSCEAPDGRFLTLVDIDSRLCIIENEFEGHIPIPDSELAAILI